MSKEQYMRYQQYNVSEYDEGSYKTNKYSDAYSQRFNEELSTKNEKSIEYEKVNNYLTISSKDRDIDAYPNSNSYSIKFNDEFKNIFSIELIQSIIPAKNSVETEPYLLLKIEELEDVMISNDRHVSDSFAILQMAPPTTTGGFIQIDKRIHENTTKFFRIPKASLNKLTISITDCFGTLFNFGTDGPTPLKALQNTFVFRIVTLEKKRDQLNHRNVY